MMTKTCDCSEYVRKDVSLPDGFSYYYYQCPKCARVEYPLKQAQALMDYSKTHLFMFVEDWILAWMSTLEDAPIAGITTMQKHMVIIIYEFAQKHRIPSENPGFKAYLYGPYTERIDRALESLDNAGYIHSAGRLNTNSERFYLTERGTERGREILSNLPSDEVEELVRIRQDVQQFTLQGLDTYVYSKYPEFTDKSQIFTRVLHRKRS